MAESAVECSDRTLATELSRARLAVAAMSPGRRADADDVPAATTVVTAGDILGRFALTRNEPRLDELARLGLVAVMSGATTADGFGVDRWM